MSHKFKKLLGVELPDMAGKFRHVCEICGKKFYLSYDCKRHKVLVHGEKNIQVSFNDYLTLKLRNLSYLVFGLICELPLFGEKNWQIKNLG